MWIVDVSRVVSRESEVGGREDTEGFFLGRCDLEYL